VDQFKIEVAIEIFDSDLEAPFKALVTSCFIFSYHWHLRVVCLDDCVLFVSFDFAFPQMNVTCITMNSICQEWRDFMKPFIIIMMLTEVWLCD
jgi:hypothetical protein